MTPLVGTHVAIGTKKPSKKRHIGSWMVVEPTHLKNMIVKIGNPPQNFVVKIKTFETTTYKKGPP